MAVKMAKDYKHEHRAIQEFRMITTGEANIRKKAGAFITTAVAIHQCISPSTLPAGPFALLIGAAIGTYRTGTCYQWGGILTGKWNLDGKGLTQIPVERGRKYAEFAKEKKTEFWVQILSSLFMGILSACFYGVMVRNETLKDVLSETSFWALGSLLATVIVSIMA